MSEPVKSPITDLLNHMEFAMYAEGIGPGQAMAVLNRLLFGRPYPPPGRQGARPSVPLSDTVPSHAVEPGQDALVFGGDAREVLAAEERPLHPLSSTCRCGRAIVRLTGDELWEHCD